MSLSDPANVASSLKTEAQRLGFNLVGIAPAQSPPGFSRFEAWLDAGFAGKMEYMEGRREAYSHPRYILDGVQSVVMLSLNYGPPAETPTTPGQARVARYAQSHIDYHDLIWERLTRLEAFLSQQVPGCRVRGVVDTAPLLEREFAFLAGMGWQGKNTMLIHPRQGSYFFLAALLTDIDFPTVPSPVTDHCGTCRQCLDACPTNAFQEPRVLDASRCISYLTIELRDPIPLELRSQVGEWLFGCDVCQTVCPWNRFAPKVSVPELIPSVPSGHESLAELFALSDHEFRQRYRKSPYWRPRRRGLLRNAAIVLGNQKCESAIPALQLGVQDVEALVRGASAWALGQIGTFNAETRLRGRLPVETDDLVRQEIDWALQTIATARS